ncbi:MAG: ABC transporter permease [Actinobacteria bacterium]|nr:ABC transporter permease [Actinomycetota bacterium]
MKPLRSMATRPVLTLAVLWVLLIAVLALLAPMLGLPDPKQFDSSATAQGPSLSHPFGTDPVGRDVFSGVIWGARVSLTVGAVSVAGGLVIGGLIGLTAGFFRGRVETVLMAFTDVMLAVPALILVVFIVALRGQSLANVLLAVLVVSVPAIARVSRAQTLVATQHDYVTAARAQGATNLRIMRREVLPNVIPPMLSFSFVAVAIVIAAEGGLAFLGLSVPSPAVTWGGLINAGRGDLDTTPQVALMPAATMFLTLLAFNLIGDALRRRFDVRESGL